MKHLQRETVQARADELVELGSIEAIAQFLRDRGIVGGYWGRDHHDGFELHPHNEFIGWTPTGSHAMSFDGLALQNYTVPQLLQQFTGAIYDGKFVDLMPAHGEDPGP